MSGSQLRWHAPQKQMSMVHVSKVPLMEGREEEEQMTLRIDLSEGFRNFSSSILSFTTNLSSVEAASALAWNDRRRDHRRSLSKAHCISNQSNAHLPLPPRGEGSPLPRYIISPIARCISLIPPPLPIHCSELL